MEYFILRDEQQEGPYSLEKLYRLREIELIDDTTLVWVDGLPSWIQFKALGNFIEFKAAQNDKVDSPPPKAKEEPKFIETEALPAVKAFEWTQEATALTLIISSLVLSVLSVFFLPQIVFVFISLILFCGAMGLLFSLQHIREENMSLAVGGLFASAIPVVVLLISLMFEPKEKPEISSPENNIASATPPEYQETKVTREVLETNESTFSGWTATSNGYTWKQASRSERMDLCRSLASASKNGNSANFFYDALDSFYTTPEVMSTKLSDITQMIENGSREIPLSERQY